MDEYLSRPADKSLAPSKCNEWKTCRRLQLTWTHRDLMCITIDTHHIHSLGFLRDSACWAHMKLLSAKETCSTAQEHDGMSRNKTGQGSGTLICKPREAGDWCLLHHSSFKVLLASIWTSGPSRFFGTSCPHLSFLSYRCKATPSLFDTSLEKSLSLHARESQA